MGPRICRICGVGFTGGPRAWFCPTCADSRRRAQKAVYNRRMKDGMTRKIGSLDKCVICGQPFEVRGGNHRYCDTCATEHFQVVDRAQSRAWAAENIDPEERKKARRRPEQLKVCAICGREFMGAQHQRYCSISCQEMGMARATRESEARRSEKKKMATVDRGGPKRTSERICAACGRAFIGGFHSKYCQTCRWPKVLEGQRRRRAERRARKS